MSAFNMQYAIFNLIFQFSMFNVNMVNVDIQYRDSMSTFKKDMLCHYQIQIFNVNIDFVKSKLISF